MYGLPLLIPFTRPTKMNDVASVATNELSLSLMMIRPLARPAATPTSSAITKARTGSRPASCIAMPAMTTERPPIAPSDRFMPPITMTIAWPMATNTYRAAVRPMLNRLYWVRKLSLPAAKMTNSTTVASTTEKSLRRRRLVTRRLTDPRDASGAAGASGRPASCAPVSETIWACLHSALDVLVQHPGDRPGCSRVGTHRRRLSKLALVPGLSAGVPVGGDVAVPAGGAGAGDRAKRFVFRAVGIVTNCRYW